MAHRIPSSARLPASDAASDDQIEAMSRGVFRHLNEEHDLGFDQPDWRLGPQTRSRLWTVTLHYHEWAYSLARAAVSEGRANRDASWLFEHFLGDWIARCRADRPGARFLAWNAYAIATRIGWWCRAYQVLGESWWCEREEFREAFLKSLWQQAAFLNDHLEWDLRANHLMRDAVGLAWAGRFFEGRRPARWLNKATRLALRQCREQVLDDGGHFERTPMYHLQIMEDLLQLFVLCRDAEARAEIMATWERMAEFARWIRHPDGGFPLLNDAALNGACALDELLECAREYGLPGDGRPARGLRHFRTTGLVALHEDSWSVFFDVGPVGSDCQPGHGQADSLTVECSVDGQRLFVDPGTHSYDLDGNRKYDRSTSSHNTVCVDDTDSSEVWHVFRVGRRAISTGSVREETSGRPVAEGAHTGYGHLAGRPVHRRVVSIADDSAFVVSDHIVGGDRHRLEGGWLVAPEWSVNPLDDGWVLCRDDTQVSVNVRGPDGLRLSQERRPYHPEFGVEIPTWRLTWHWEGALPMEVTTECARAAILTA